MSYEPDQKVTLCTFLCKVIECNVWSVGFYNPRGEWIEVSQASRREIAFHKVHVLHGGGLPYLDFLRIWGKEG